ncbi:MAG: glycosyltransferase [Oscillospiraceae bacterium]|jgi:glycosyltransferase involved in cell wall biosynthesis|nr:glycosyltransferase [Oscillospiraceae bacterium]
MINVINVITDSNIGGAGLVLVNFMRRSDKTEFCHRVILPEGAQLTPRLRELGIDTLEIPGIDARSFSPGAVRTFHRLFKELRPDIVHTHASLSARVAARLYGRCKTVHTRHCAFDIRRALTVFPLRALLGAMNNALSDVIIAISPAARDNLTDMGTSPDKIVTMMNGVEPVPRLTDAEIAAVRAQYGVADGELVAVLIARIETYKGHEYVIDAAARLGDLPLRFIFAGTGSAEAELRESVRARGLDNCVFTGFVSDVGALENIADIQLNASYGTETSSLALLEGMSLGVPSIVSDFGGNPSLVFDGENGIIVPRRDADALADAIRRLCEDARLRGQISRRAGEIYAERFTAQAPVRKVETIYRALAGGGGIDPQTFDLQTKNLEDNK